MTVLDRKLLRDLWRMWAQLLAVSLVMACGVATIILSIGAYRALKETQATFYGQYRFATVFAGAVRAPKQLQTRIRAIPGMARSEFRIVKPVIIDVVGMAEPASGIVISLPTHELPEVNRLYLREGRLPISGRRGEVAVIESFAKGHGLGPGDSFAAILNGKRQQLRVVGVVLSPEYIYTIGPGDIVPDPRRFAVFYMSRPALEGVFDMEGAFNSLVAITQKTARIESVLDAIDVLLKPYGGTLAYQRKDQTSHAFLDNELTQLQAMAFVIPPIFLFVAAFLVNMILARLIALEREQVGLMKAIGYGKSAIAWHYAKLVIAMALLGFAIGAAGGAWLGRGLASIYQEFFAFPFLVFRESFDLYAISAAVCVGTALAGAIRAISAILALEPAVAMQPPVPTRYRRWLAPRSVAARLVSPTTTMALRHLIRWPLRTAMTTLGISMSVALLITALFSFDSIESLIDTLFFRTERQDATLTFAGDRAPGVMSNVISLPGVLYGEEFRQVAVSLRRGHRSRNIGIIGLPRNGTLAQVLDTDLNPVPMPRSGLLVSDHLAKILKLKPGDIVELELLEYGHRIVRTPVSAIAKVYVGLAAYMDLDALNRVAGDGPRVSGARIRIDELERDDLFRAIKQTPGLESIALLDISRQHFRATIEQNIFIQTAIYILFAGIITFGVVYNSARIQLAEYARELASLRVLGFSKREVSMILLVELGVMIAAAQPLGWLLGYWFSWTVVRGFESDLFRIPLIISPATYAWASIVVFVAAVISSLIVRRRIDRLDLVRVLKTRE